MRWIWNPETGNHGGESVTKKDPISWMPWYVIDWLMDPEIGGMSGDARAGYFDLLCWQWYQGGLPDDDQALQRRSRLAPEVWARERETIRALLQKCDDGKLRQSRCVTERDNALRLVQMRKKRTEKARQVRLQRLRNRRKQKRIDCDSHCGNTVTDQLQANRTLHLQDITIQEEEERLSQDPKKEPEQAADPPAPDGGNGKDQRIPAGHFTHFDWEPRRDALLARYFSHPGTDLDAWKENFAELFCGDDGKPRRIQTIVGFLEEASQFDVGQVAAAMAVMVGREVRGDRMRYLMALIRKDAGRYQAKMQREEIRREEREHQERARSQSQPVGQSAADALPRSCGNLVRDVVLRTLPPVRRARGPEERASAEASNDFQDGS